MSISEFARKEAEMDPEITLRPKFVYEAIPIDSNTYDRLDLGSDYNGGVVVDGLCDDDQHLVIVKYKA